ncbi:MAG TPA: flagellar hook-length control protein FliK [Candidatus Aminicenantes bacterium]|nr:flagellar hook-length control protein FliK [Candidatus Aminicenantes bacterium]
MANLIDSLTPSASTLQGAVTNQNTTASSKTKGKEKEESPSTSKKSENKVDEKTFFALLLQTIVAPQKQNVSPQLATKAGTASVSSNVSRPQEKSAKGQNQKSVETTKVQHLANPIDPTANEKRTSSNVKTNAVKSTASTSATTLKTSQSANQAKTLSKATAHSAQEKSEPLKAVVSEKSVTTSQVEQVLINPQSREVQIVPLSTKGTNASASASREVPAQTPILNEIVDLVQNTEPSGQKVFRIHLDPPELGKLYIQLSFSSDKRVEVKMYAQNPEIQSSLLLNSDQLKSTIDQLGFRSEIPVIASFSDMPKESNGEGKDSGENRGSKTSFRIVRTGQEKDLHDEYTATMETLAGRIDLRV